MTISLVSSASSVRPLSAKTVFHKYLTSAATSTVLSAFTNTIQLKINSNAINAVFISIFKTILTTVESAAMLLVAAVMTMAVMMMKMAALAVVTDAVMDIAMMNLVVLIAALDVMVIVAHYPVVV